MIFKFENILYNTKLLIIEWNDLKNVKIFYPHTNISLPVFVIKSMLEYMYSPKFSTRTKCDSSSYLSRV